MRGVIMEIKNGRAVLLTKGGEFVNVKNKGYSVGDKVNIASNTGRLCAMAASLLVACAGIGSYFVPAGYVSVDINPSLMMTLNPYNRVIDVQTFNDDARILLSKIDIKGKGAEESVEILIKASEEIGYINDNNRDVILEIVPGMIKPNMERIHHPNIELTNETADRETLRMAQNIGVSMAKVKAIEEYTEKNGGDMRSNAAKFNDKSAKEMRAITHADSNSANEKSSEAYDLATPKPQKDRKTSYRQPARSASISPVSNKLPIWDIELERADNISTVSQPLKEEGRPVKAENAAPSVPVKAEEPKRETFEYKGSNHKNSEDKNKPQEPEDRDDDREDKDLSDNSQNDKKPPKSEPEENTRQEKPVKRNDDDDKNKPQMSEKEQEPPPKQEASQQRAPKRDDTPQQNNSKQGEPKHESAPQQNNLQNDGGNHQFGEDGGRQSGNGKMR